MNIYDRKSGKLLFTLYKSSKKEKVKRKSGKLLSIFYKFSKKKNKKSKMDATKGKVDDLISHFTDETLSKMTKPDLENLASSYNLDTSGTKSVIIKRIKSYHSSKESEPGPSNPIIKVNSDVGPNDSASNVLSSNLVDEVSRLSIIVNKMYQVFEASNMFGNKTTGKVSVPIDSSVETNLNPHAKEFKMAEPDAPNVANPITSQVPEEFMRNMYAAVMSGKKSKVPQYKLKTFNNDVLEYRKFISDFETQIECYLDSEYEKLSFLIQYTTGTANAIASSCVSLPKNEGYQEARKLLEQEFGKVSCINEACAKKIMAFPNIRSNDKVKLDEFRLLLMTSYTAVKHIPHEYREVENSTFKKKVIMKLPERHQHRFKEFSYKKEKINEMLRFEDIVDFVTTISAEEKQFDIAPELLESKSKIKKETRSFATSLSHNSRNRTYAKKCNFCEENHPLYFCDGFKLKSASDKLAFVKGKKLCHSCLKGGHTVSQCFRPQKCRVCNRIHNTLLHESFLQNSQRVNRSSPNNSSDSEEDNVETVSSRSMSTKKDNFSAKMNILPVKIKSKTGNWIKTLAFIDGGSTTSFCSQSLLKKINTKNTSPIKLFISTVTNSKKEVNTCIVNNLSICDVEEKNIIKLPPLYAIDKVPVGKSEMVTKKDVSRKCFRKLLNHNLNNLKVELLLGANVKEAFEPIGFISSKNKDDQFAIKTKLGWSIMGAMVKGNKNHKINRINILGDFENEFKEDLSDLYSNKKSMSQEDKKFMEIVNKECVKDEKGHYELPLPFRDNEVKLQNNRPCAIIRANSLKYKMLKDDNYYNQYKEYMDTMLKENYAEIVPKHEINNDKVWYIPHFGVYHPKKPGKLRIVFDCSAKYENECLNDKLIQGPDLTNNLFDVLLRFRFGKYAYVADVQHMFLRVRVAPKDRDYLRFFWWNDSDLKSDIQEYRMNVHLFGATSSPSCANFALRKCALDNYDKFNEEALNTVLTNFYVDDLLKSLDCEKDLVDNAHQVKEICATGAFNLGKFVSNSKKLLNSLEKEEIDSKFLERSISKQGDNLKEKALGLCWKVKDDLISVEVCNKHKKESRRGMLSTIGSVYDPIGIVAPYVVQGKLLLQELCRLKYDWDDELPHDIKLKWNRWSQGLEKVGAVSIPRNVVLNLITSKSKLELHHFSDASSTAYAIVSYIRLINDNNVYCSFLCGKCLVAPLKIITIPRLELMAATLMVKMHIKIKEALSNIEFETTKFWTDSQTVLKYIKNEKSRFHVFVANRVALIRNYTSLDQWNYVPSEENPADDGSRGLQSDRWLTGPSFLLNKSEWPKQINDYTISKDDAEVKIRQMQVDSNDHPLNKLINYYSDWFKLKLAVAWILKVKNQLINKSKVVEPLKPSDLKIAEFYIISFIQDLNFDNELKMLRKDSKIQKSSNLVLFDPFIDTRDTVPLIRVGGRLKNSSLSYDEKHPIILPKKCKVTDMIVNDCHVKLGHTGKEHILSKLREKYWILNGNSAVKSLINKCIICKKLRGKPIIQKMADLPKERLESNQPPFNKVGVDYFGPFYTKCLRSQVKRYGVIFTCMASRAVHIEMAYSLDVSSFINCLKRFISRRGLVSTIFSDRGTNFVGAEKELNTLLSNIDSKTLKDYCLKNNIEWKFNPPNASNFGGVWERLIKEIRKILNGIIKEQTLSDDYLITLFCEVENIINSRPLTVISCDKNDISPLTPNHLLHLRNETLYMGEFDKNDCYSIRRWKQVQYLANLFWNRWRKEYLSTLQKRLKWVYKERNVQIGDIVLIIDENQPRCNWLMGKIISVKQSLDNLIRSVEIQTKDSILVRPVNKLVLLLENSFE